MRLRAALFAVIVLAGAGYGAWKLAGTATPWYEQTVATRLQTALASAGQPWASVEVDGLKVTLKGAAPDESSRFRALEVARQVVDGIDDATTVRAAAPLPPPSFALELLRNDADVSLIGLVPETGGRDVIRVRARRRRPQRACHRHARIVVRPGTRRLAGGARLRPLGALRAAARQGQRRPRHGGGDRGRRQRRRPRGAGSAAPPRRAARA